MIFHPPSSICQSRQSFGKARLKTASKWSIALLGSALGVSVVTAPMTGGLSMSVAAGAAALTGIEIIAITAVALLGLGLVLLIIRDYERMRFKAKSGDAEAEFEMGRK